jgi:hypothetical protein
MHKASSAMRVKFGKALAKRTFRQLLAAAQRRSPSTPEPLLQSLCILPT